MPSSSSSGEARAPVDVSLLTNDQLRPWTLDPVLELRLTQEMDALENTIHYVSPQKKGGNRGDSVIDVSSMGLVNFKKTIHQTLRASTEIQNAFEQRFEPYTSAMKHRGGGPSLVHNDNLLNSHHQDSQSTDHKSHPATPAVATEVPHKTLSFEIHTDFHDEDPDTDRDSQVDRLQEKIRKYALAHHPQLSTSRPGSVSSVRYHTASNPAIISLRRGEFNLLQNTTPLSSPTSHRPTTSPFADSHTTSFNYLQTVRHASPTRSTMSMDNFSVSGSQMQMNKHKMTNSPQYQPLLLTPIPMTSNDKNLMVMKNRDHAVVRAKQHPLSAVKSPKRAVATKTSSTK
jgi:hypothetical protein